MRNSMRDGGVDRVFRDIAADAEIVIFARLLGQAAALFAHLIGGLPCADDHFAHPPHCLTVRRNDRKRAHIVQDVFGGDGFAADAAFGEGDIFGDGFVQMVADHQHIEMFLDRVHGEGPCWVG